ncbi:MAG TPA: 50S ribosomal protein L1 [Candidatus Acetothermia bacterium]|nr:50S ribosomal protein L1 [Candidatus Acetothermia bacterium]
MKHGKRYASVAALIEPRATYSFAEAVQKLKTCATAKFDETAEVTFVLGIIPSRVNIRGACSLPNGTGKTVRILAFAKGEAATEAEQAGADHVGGEDLAKRIQEGWFDFDKVVATPDMMSVVGKLGKVLGPRNLMPSPKTGTVTKDIGQVIAELKGGMVEYRSDRQGVIHTLFGKASFEESALEENLTAIVRSVGERRPEEGVKGRYVRKVSIASTMGPGITLDSAEVNQIVDSTG